MFRIISTISFIIAFVGIAFHYIAFRPKLGKLAGKERKRLSLLGILKRLVYLLALICFVVLVVTGFYPALVLGKPLSGYLLMAHATAAPVFAGCLAVLALFWAQHYCFNHTDCPWLQRILKRIIHTEQLNKDTLSESYCIGQKVCFWLIILLALPVILSIVLSMFHIFGTHAQELLLQLHRYSSLTLALLAIVHTYLIILAQARR